MGNAAFREPRLDLGACDIQHRAQEVFPHRRDAAESPQARAARKLQQERLGVVIGGVRRCDPLAALLLGAGAQKRIPRLTRLGFTALHRSPADPARHTA